MRILDAGHKYQLDTLDGQVEQQITFVKRNNPTEHYPGNIGAYPGTTTQEVLRCLIDRLKYVQTQIPCSETADAITLLRQAIFMLEVRAKRVKGKKMPMVWLNEIETYLTCPVCGHIKCEEWH